MTKFCREDESSYIKGHLWSFGFPFQDRGRINRQQHQKAVREAGRTDARSAVSGTKITLLTTVCFGKPRTSAAGDSTNGRVRSTFGKQRLLPNNWGKGVRI